MIPKHLLGPRNGRELQDHTNQLTGSVLKDSHQEAKTSVREQDCVPKATPEQERGPLGTSVLWDSPLGDNAENQAQQGGHR